MKFLGVEILQSIINFFATIKDSLSLEYLLYIFVGLEILTIIAFIFIIYNVYELKLIRAVDKINAYLYEVQYIDESNLIEFNNRMKKVPKTLRYHWQQYMLYRNGNPSQYMSIENCIDRPIKSSSFSSNIRIVKCLGFIYGILAFIFSCGWASGLASMTPDYFIVVFAIPLVVLLLNYFFIIGLNIKQSNNTTDLYQTFHIFNRFIDKAVTTMPEYVDFEVLFTRKEIKRGIPVLNEYIEKRQLQEQEELKKARENAIQHELYDFDEAGEKGELVLERAMRETEIFVGMRNRLNGEIEQLDKEIDSLKRNYENTTKDYQKKLQASKENIERLREQQEATTNRIENNYIRKQQADEIKKQQQIEKDQDDATLRYNQEINNLAIEIKKRKDELEEAKLGVQTSMLAEYKTFANKLFVEVRDSVADKIKIEKQELISSREEVAHELEETLGKLESLEKQNDILVNKAKEREAFIRAESAREKAELAAALEKKEQELAQKDKQIDIISTDYSIQKTIESPKDKNSKKAKKGKAEAVVSGEFSFDDEVKVAATPNNIEKKAGEFDEFGGYYDSEGNYRYANGSYYDAAGYFHDENGNIYDKEGNLVENNQTQTSEATLKQGNIVTEKTKVIEEEKPVGEFKFDSDFNNFDEFEEEHGKKAIDNIEIPKEILKDIKSSDFIEDDDSDTIIATVEAPVIEEADGIIESTIDESVNEIPKPEALDIKPAGKRGRPRKEIAEIEEEKPAGKRGRPKKEQSATTMATKSQGKRGRPKKEEVVVKTQGKRGRPKKEEIEDKKPVGKRGRPKKDSTPVVIKKKESKRGRPKKENIEVKKPAGKRGRPKKVDIDENLKMIQTRLKEQNKLLKKQQKALDLTVKKVSAPKKKSKK